MKLVKDLVPASSAMLYRYEKVNSSGTGTGEYIYLKYAPGTLAQEGTPVNADLFNTLQGFETKNTVFNSASKITETDVKSGAVKTTTFNSDGSITEVLTDGGKSITKKTTFNSNGSISEVVS